MPDQDRCGHTDYLCHNGRSSFFRAYLRVSYFFYPQRTVCFCVPPRSPIHKILPCDMYTSVRKRIDRAPESFDTPVRGFMGGGRFPLFAHHPLRRRARYDSLPDGRMGSRPRPTNIARRIHLIRSVTPIIFAIFHSRLCI